MRPSPTESRWASMYSRSPNTQHACGDAPDAKKNSILQQNYASKPNKSTVRGWGWWCHGKEGCSVPPPCPNCSGPHRAAWLACPEHRTRLLANKTTNMQAIQSRCQTGRTDTVQQYCNQQTTPHMHTRLKANNKPQHTKHLATRASLFMVVE